MLFRLACALIGVLVVSAPALAQTANAVAGVYRLDPTHASLTWKVRHFGLSNYTARFTKFDATLELDPARLDAAKLSVTIDPASIRTDYPDPAKVDFDKELAFGAKWFNAKVHSQITFVSSRVEPSGDGKAKVTGDLTLLGVTKPVTLDVALVGAVASHPLAKKPAMGFTATGVVTRSQFGLTNLAGLIGDDVSLQIEAELIAQ